jgi:ligand-binding sensor domain-containing protein
VTIIAGSLLNLDCINLTALRQFILFSLLVCCLQCAKAQQSNYLFQRLGVKDGLFEETVHAIQQDAKGYLWLNFRTLIQRYDGHRFLNFLPGSKLPEGNVRDMLIDKKNRLWLLSGEASLGYLNPDNFKYHPVKVNIPKAFTPVVTNMYINKQDEIMLVWDKQGFITCNAAAGVADEKYNPFTLPKGWGPMHILQDEEYNYWIGTVNGLVKYNTAKKIISYREHNEENDVVVKTFEQLRPVNGVHRDKAKNITVVSWDGEKLKIHAVNLKSGKLYKWDEMINAVNKNGYYELFGITETAGNALWLTGDNIFCRIKPEQESAEFIPNTSLEDYSIRYDVIFSIFEDREKNIWLGTDKGLFRFNPEAKLFSAFKNKRSNDSAGIKIPVTGFLETADEQLLVSTWGSSIFSYNTKLNPTASATMFQKKTADMAMVWCMLKRKNGDVWFGMQDGSVYVFDAASRKIKLLAVATTGGKTIRQMAADKNGNIWMGTHSGDLIEWNATTEVFTKRHQFGGLISRIRIDSTNRLWVGTGTDGLYCINPTNGKVIRHYTTKDEKDKKLLYQGVADILQYNDSVFYIAGNGLSILNANTNHFQYFTVADGLPSSNITNLIKDKNGYIWMTTGSGIVSYHPAKRKLSHYDASDGVHNYNFNTGAASMLQNGNIVFGTDHDFLMFNPDELTKRTYPPPKVQIAGIEIMGKPKSVDSLLQLPVIELQHNQNAFKAFFTTLKYKDVHAVFYMLDGIDKKWKKADKANVVEYNYVPNGTYMLKAACLHEDGSVGEITSLKIHIAAPFYKTWWFYSLLVLAAGGLLFWFDRERTKRKEAMQQMRSNIANKLHQDVSTALGNINILSEMASLKADTEPQKSKEFIEQIHSKSHNMMIAMDDMLWAISPDNDSMEKTVDRMQEYIDALNNRHEAYIEMLVEEKVKSLNIDMQLRHEAFLLFKESISSLVKAGAKHCKIHLRLGKTDLIYIMECKNEDCDMQQLNNLLHRQDIAKRLEAIRAKMDVQVHKSISVLQCRVQL